jgi:hypothetical protein
VIASNLKSDGLKRLRGQRTGKIVVPDRHAAAGAYAKGRTCLRLTVAFRAVIPLDEVVRSVVTLEGTRKYILTWLCKEQHYVKDESDGC